MKDRKGITLTSLVIVIIIMLILAGVGTYTGINTVRYVKRTQFNNELKIIHARVDEIVEKKLTQEELNEYGKAIEEQTDEIKQKIQTALEGTENTGFRYFEKQDLEEIGVDGIDRQVIINFSTREVVDINGINVDGIYIYRMEKWNPVEYQNQNTEAPTFNLSKKVYGLNATIEVTDIEYKNGITKGSIRYGEVIDGEVTLWKTGSSSITIEKSGTYRVQVIDAAGNVAEKDVEVALANKPKLVDGMTPVVYDENIGKWKVVDEASGDWYDYATDSKKWANAMTQDGLQINSDGTIASFGSMWVWIPRYMYQIPAANYHTSNAGVINVKFLKGTTNIATDGSNVKIANASGGDNWNVHPAFCDGTSNGFANGEWDKELTGMWVAKFEAGYASGNNNAPVVASNVYYEPATGWGSYMEVSTTATSDGIISARNWLDGIYEAANTMPIKYPTFQPLTYSMNYINHSDAYEISRDLTSANNIYGFTSSSADTHLMKDSEWGMVAYFSQSKYRIKWNRNSSQ